MLKEEVEIMISDIRSFMRDFKIKELMDDTGNKIEIVAPKKGIFSFIWPGHKTMNQLRELDGIICGSRALSMYRINGQPIISRKPEDWDFLLDRKSFMKFCGLNNLKDLMYEHDRITVNLTTGIYTYNAGYGSYDPRYLFRHDFDIICKEILPMSIYANGYNVATLESIMEEKLKLIENRIKSSSKTENIQSKHILDCIQIMTKIEAYGK